MSVMSAVARMNSSNCFLDPAYPAMELSTSIPTITLLCAKSQVTLPVSKTIVPFIPDLSLVLNPVLNDSLFFVQFNPVGRHSSTQESI